MLAVDGPSGAGKSTLAAAVAEELGAGLVSTDAFATWDNPVAWWPQLERGVLEPLSAGRSGAYRQVDWTSGEPRPGALVTVEVPRVLVLEGVSSGRRAVRSRLSHLCWVEGGTQEARLERAVARDGEPSRADLRRWQLFEQGWFAVDGTRESAQTRLP
ncbi:uridine kinase family protein [Amycolatopsis sp. NPDC004368]